MEAVRESWTDDRLDNFRERVEERFDSVDRRFDEVDRRFDEVNGKFDKVDKKFDKFDARLDRFEGRVEDRLDSIQRTMVAGVIALSAAMVAGFAGVMGLLAALL